MQRDPPLVSGPPAVEPGAAPDAATPPVQGAHRGRLFRKYLLLILSLVTIVLLASSGINLYFSYRENRTALSSLQREKAIGAASRIEQYIRQVSQQLAYASLPQLDATDVEARRIEFLKLLRQAPEVTDIAQLDAAGREQIVVSRLGMDIVASNKDRSAEAAFQQARRGQPWYGPVYFRKETEPYMTIAIRSGGERSPVTVAEVNLKFIWDVVSRIKIGAKGKAYVVDAAGLLVADPDIGLVLRKTNLAALPHVQAAVVMDAEDDVAMVSKDLAGTPVLTSVAAIDPLAWKVFVEQPIAEVYAKLNASIARTGALLLAGLVISALAASALARGMVRPIRTLDEGAQRIGAGDLEQHIDVKTGDELEGLADQFNRMAGQLRESYAGLERKVEQRTAELSESLDYQTAISDVLRVISESPTDVTPVFEAILNSASRLFGSPLTVIYRFDGKLMHLVSARNWPADALEAAHRLLPAPPNTRLMGGRVILARAAVTLDDAQADPSYEQALAVTGRWRRVIGAPMLKDGEPIGAICLSWPEPGATPRKHCDLLKTFADQAVIAIENVRLINETKEALEQQTATAEVLQVISGSMADAKPVFDKILQSCRRLFASGEMGITLVGDDGMLRLAAHVGSARERLEKQYPRPVDASPVGLQMAGHAVVHLPDVLGTPGVPPAMRQIAEEVGNYAIMVAPMLWEGRNIGSIHVTRQPPSAFADKEIALLKTFADQAVIAIQNARLFNETKEALARQTATADILQVISASVADTQPVFDKILESSMHLFGSSPAAVSIQVIGDDDRYQLVGYSGPSPQTVRQMWPKSREEAGASELAARERRVLNYPDVLHGSDVPEAVREIAQQIGRNYALIVAPMLWQEQGIGSISAMRDVVAPFNDKEAGLLKTFADQAVIAIQNARLFNETKEALEQQTATAGILGVISSSPTDTQPVFDAIVETGLHLFGGLGVGIALVDGDRLRIVAEAGTKRSAAGLEIVIPLDRHSAIGRAIVDGIAVNVGDTETAGAPSYTRDAGRSLGFRAIAATPMNRDGRAVGAIAVMQKNPGGLSEKEISLLKTFADQAVIAIQNVRLFNETKEALEQQTATAEVLQVISSSVADAQPVFDKILHGCEQLFAGTRLSLLLVGDNGKLHLGAYRDEHAETYAEFFPARMDGTATEWAIRERRVVSFSDVSTDASVSETVRAFAATLGTRSMVVAPLLWEDKGMGAIIVGRDVLVPFTDKEKTLLRTFADQAVIAIRNTRLFHEIEDKSRQLEIANRHKSEFLANMSHELRTPLNAIIGFSEVLTEQMFGDVNDKQMEYLHDIHSSGQHLLTLINDVLDLSKIEAGRMELELSCFDLGLLLDNSMTLVRERAQRQGLALTLDVGEGLEEWVADARKVKQVVVNLLSNAVKFTPTGGSVTVRARRVDVGGNAFAQVSVADTGVGIAPEEQAMVFEEFRQASGDYLRKTEGTGLGLSLAKRFAELHGGTIRIDSERGKGATFTVTLPQLVLEALS